MYKSKLLRCNEKTGVYIPNNDFYHINDKFSIVNPIINSKHRQEEHEARFDEIKQSLEQERCVDKTMYLMAKVTRVMKKEVTMSKTNLFNEIKKENPFNITNELFDAVLMKLEEEDVIIKVEKENVKDDENDDDDDKDDDKDDNEDDDEDEEKSENKRKSSKSMKKSKKMTNKQELIYKYVDGGN